MADTIISVLVQIWMLLILAVAVCAVLAVAFAFFRVMAGTPKR